MLPDRKRGDSGEPAERSEEKEGSSYFGEEVETEAEAEAEGRKVSIVEVEVEVQGRRKRWARPPVLGGGSGSESEEPRLSPSSSVASLRPLEWDSGADVGYSCFPPGGGERREPEGRTREVESKLGAPTAESTPKYQLFPEAAAGRRGSASSAEDRPSVPSSVPTPTVRPSNSSSSVNTVVTNSESRHQEEGEGESRGSGVEWVSVEGEAERGVEALTGLIEGREPALAQAILHRVFTRIMSSPTTIDKCIGTASGDVPVAGGSNLKPCLKSESVTDTSSEKRACSSSSVSGGRRWERRTEWRRAATTAERLREAHVDTSSESLDEKKLADLVNCERKTQLEWIRSEIRHLSSLQALLERHEELKKNVTKLKRHNNQRKTTPVAPVENQAQHQESSSGWSSHHYCETEGSCGEEERVPGAGGRRGGRRTVATSTSAPLPPPAPLENVAVQTSPKALAYDITFAPPPPKPKARMVSLEELHAALDQILKPTTLQDELLDKRPEVVERAEERRKIVQELVALRRARTAKKRQIIATGSSTSPLPPPPLAVKRAVSNDERRRRKAVDREREKEESKKKEEAHRTNRLMAQIFNRKLQARTLKGQVDLSNSTSVISSL